MLTDPAQGSEILPVGFKTPNVLAELLLRMKCCTGIAQILGDYSSAVHSTGLGMVGQTGKYSIMVEEHIKKDDTLERASFCYGIPMTFVLQILIPSPGLLDTMQSLEVQL